VEPASQKSFTELEYDYATSLGKHVLSFVMNQEAIDAREEKHKEFIERHHRAQLDAFRARVLNNGLMADLSSSADALDGQVGNALRQAERTSEVKLAGWVRGTDTANTAKALDEMTLLSEENRTLKAQVDQLRSVAAAAPTYVPPLATRELRIVGQNSAGEETSQVSNYFDWFLNCGRLFHSGISRSDFLGASVEYVAKRKPEITTESLGSPFADLCEVVLAEFKMFGWVEEERVYSGALPLRLTLNGRAMFLRHAHE
jgi:hypothetical protein